MKKKRFVARSLAGILMVAIITDFTPIQAAAKLEQTQEIEKEAAEEETDEKKVIEKESSEEEPESESTEEELPEAEESIGEDIRKEETVGAGVGGEETEEEVYILMNIPYDDFYEADLRNEKTVEQVIYNDKGVLDTDFLSGCFYRQKGSLYEVLGVTFPVKLGEGVELSDLSECEEAIGDGQKVLSESGRYTYCVLEEEPEFYKELTVADGKFCFGEMEGFAQITDANVTLRPESGCGNYGILVDAEELENAELVYGVILSTETHDYGLRHLDNILQTMNLTVSTGLAGHYQCMAGETISKIVYFTNIGILEMDTELYIPFADESIFRPVEYNEDPDAPALIVSDGYSVFEAEDYMLNITSVYVNGKFYEANDGDVIIRADGKLNVEADAFAGGDVFEVIVSSEGYGDLQFSYVVGEGQEKQIRQLLKDSSEPSIFLVDDIGSTRIKGRSSSVISSSLEHTEDNGRAVWTYQILRKVQIPAGK